MTRGRRRHSRAGRVRDERGATAVELVLMAWVLVGFIVTVVGAGRFVDGRGQVNDAAYAAARAASLAPNLDAARVAGQRAARESLAVRGKACTTLTVSLAGTDFRSAGHVKAEVTCQADLSDVVGFGLPGTKSFTATAVVPIEQYRRIDRGLRNSEGLP
jgi:Flp pilus assembly protein TadG